jgi:hypothetical protein
MAPPPGGSPLGGRLDPRSRQLRYLRASSRAGTGPALASTVRCSSASAGPLEPADRRICEGYLPRALTKVESMIVVSSTGFVMIPAARAIALTSVIVLL